MLTIDRPEQRIAVLTSDKTGVMDTATAGWHEPRKVACVAGLWLRKYSLVYWFDGSPTVSLEET